MVEKLLKASVSYYLWLLFLCAVICVCGIVYIDQLLNGLGITGMSRDVSWGLYISQFTYFVGVAASAVMLVLPAYFHHYVKFKKMIILVNSWLSRPLSCAPSLSWLTLASPKGCSMSCSIPRQIRSCSMT